MRRLWAIAAIACASSAGHSAHAADQDGLRLRERLPVPAVERPNPTLEGQGRDAETSDAFKSQTVAAPRAIKLDGAVAIAQESFEPIFLRYVNRSLKRADLVSLTREITDVYRGQGYFLSRAVVPPQRIDDGVLTVSVEEGRYARVEFESGGGEDLIDYLGILLAEVPARRATLERAILTLGDLSGVRVVSSRSEPVQGERGSYTLVLKIERDATDGLIYVDNRGEGGGDAVQMSAQAGFNGVGVVGGRLQLDVFAEPGNPARGQFSEISYSAPLGLRGTIATLSVSASNSVDGDFGLGRYRAHGTEVSLSLKQPVVRTRAHSMWVNLDLAQSNGSAELETLGLRRDELSIARIGAVWDLRDGWGGRNRLSAGVAFGRDGFKTASPAHPMARLDDGATYTKFTLAANRTQSLSEQWSLYAGLRGQYSSDDLPIDEEISFGGARWGRAFDYGEIEGDTGAAGQLELRYTLEKLGLIQSLQAYTFADVAAVWTRGGEGEAETLSSAGLGLRAAFGGGYRAGMEAAIPLDRLPTGKTDRDPRLFATVSKEF